MGRVVGQALRNRGRQQSNDVPYQKDSWQTILVTESCLDFLNTLTECWESVSGGLYILEKVAALSREHVTKPVLNLGQLSTSPTGTI